MAPRGKTKIIGTKTVTTNLLAAGDRWKQALSAALYLEGNNIIAASKRLVPVDLGTLRASGYVTLPQEQGGKILVEIGYGGAGSKDYALVQHERLDFKHPEGGQAKYLEAAVDERTPNIPANILRLAKAHFEAGTIPRAAGAGMAPTDPNQGEQMLTAVTVAKFLRKFGKPMKGGKKGGK